MTLYYFTIVLVAMYVVEAFHDYNVQKVQKANMITQIKNWHKFDFLFHTISACLLSHFCTNTFEEFIIILTYTGFIRMFVLNTTLNLLNNKLPWYLGSVSIIDKTLKKYEVIVWVLLIIILVFYYTMFIDFDLY